jgi:hypothetical protein
LIVVLGAILAAVSWTLQHRARSPGDVSGADSPARRPEGPQAPALSIVSTRAHQSESGDIWYVDGQVQNLTKYPLTNLQVVVTWFDPAGVQVATNIALIDVEKLLPGDISIYRTSTRTLKDMSRFDVQFQSDRGQRLLARDDSHGSFDTAPTVEGDASRVIPVSGGPSAEPLPSR